MMKNNNFHGHGEIPPEQENVSGFDHKAVAINFVEQLHPTHILKLVMAAFNIILSVSVIIGVSLAKVLEPLWVASLLGVVAGLSLMLTLFYLYITFVRKDNSKDILRRSLKRAMRFKN